MHALHQFTYFPPMPAPCMLFTSSPIALPPQYRYGTSTMEALRTLWSQGGIPRFYQGLAPALIQVRKAHGDRVLTFSGWISAPVDSLNAVTRPYLPYPISYLLHRAR